MCLSKNIRYLRRKRNLSQEDIANKLGYKSYTTIQKWEMGISEPSIGKLRVLAAIFNVDMNDMTTKNLELEENRNAHRPAGAIPLDADAPRIKVLGRVAAGVPIDAVEDIIGTIDVPELKGREKEYFALQVQGDSMSPKIEDGDIVIIHEQPDAESGEIVVASVNGHDATCKKLLKYDAGITLLPLNSNYDPIVISNVEIREKPVTIYGKVKEIRRKL